MSDKTLSSDLLCWLLQPEDPSIRYFTLREFKGYPESDPKVVAAFAAIMTSDPVKTLLSFQLPNGAWEEPDMFYRNKFKGTVWNLITLAELGVDGRDPGIRRACEYLFENSQRPNGGFTALPKTDRGVVPCLTGNITRSLAVLGYGEDPRLDKALRHLAKTQMPDGGWLCSQRSIMRGVTHSCFWGTLKVLWAFSEVPPEKRTKAMQTAIQQGAEFLLSHHLYRTAEPSFAQISRHWFAFTFPSFYSCDLPFALRVLTKLGYGQDKRLEEARSMVLAKRDEKGRWAMERTYPGKVLYHFGRLGQPNKWVTLNSLRGLINPA